MLAIGGTSTGSGGGGSSYTDEQVRDTIGAALVAGSNVSIVVDDAGDTITISASVPAGYNDEQAQDAFAALIAAGTHSGISFSYNDAGNAISATVSAQTWSQITGKPTFATVATSGSYSDLANQPAITPPTRNLTAGTGLTGGGDLSADRSFAVAYGTTSGTAAQGNDARLSDQRTPTDGSVNDAKVATNAAIAEAKLALASDAAAGTASRRTLGTGATQAAAGNDTRLSDARTPTAHTHPASDLTATGTRDSTTFLRGDNTWAAINAGYTPTATKTAAYTAAPGELVMVDASGGAVTVTAPAAAAGRTFGVKKLDSSANVVTIAAAGTDSIGSQAAATFPLRTNDQATYFAYNPNATTNWVATHNHLSLASLDLRYPAAATVPAAERTVTANTTAVAGETLRANATSGAIAITPPASPATGTRVFLVKTDSTTNAVTWNGTVSGDTGGVVLSAAGAGVTLVYSGSVWWLESTTTAAVGKTGTGSAPISAGTRAGQYDPRTNTYWPSGGALRAIRGQLSKAATGSTPSWSQQLVQIVVAGDSRVAGYFPNGGTPADSWPSQLRARLAASGFPSAGTGLVMAQNSSGTDARIVFAGSWNDQYPYKGWGASGATATFTSDVAGSVVEVYYYTNSGTFTVKVDSGSAVPVTPAGGGTNIAKYAVTGLAATTHTVTVTATSAAGYLIGFCVRNTTGVLVHAVGYAAITSTQLAATGATTLQQIISFIDPAILGVEIGVNDPGNSITAATTSSNLVAITTTNNPNPAKFFLAQSPNATYESVWPAYVAATYDRADALGAPLLDLADRFVSPALGAAVGLLSTDQLHETVVGAHDVARAVTGMLTA